MVADAGLDDCLGTAYDAVVLPGGLEGAKTFAGVCVLYLLTLLFLLTSSCPFYEEVEVCVTLSK